MAGRADGCFDEAFLKIPDEVIRATIRNNQKCFVCAIRRPGARQSLHPHGEHRGRRRRQGNHRRQRARHPRAPFGCEVLLRDDLKLKLEDRLPRFKDIVFHEKLGTQAERIERSRDWQVNSRRSSARMQKMPGAPPDSQSRSAVRVVGEFPEVQGTMGNITRWRRGKTQASPPQSKSTTSQRARTIACRAIRCPSRLRSPTRSTRWSASGQSTRSRPAARTLRAAQAALGVIRIVLDNALRLNLLKIVDADSKNLAIATNYCLSLRPPEVHCASRRAPRSRRCRAGAAWRSADDLLLIVRRVDALSKFLSSDDGKSLLAGVKRASNILRIEEKKDADLSRQPDSLFIFSPKNAHWPPRSMP